MRLPRVAGILPVGRRAARSLPERWPALSLRGWHGTFGFKAINSRTEGGAAWSLPFSIESGNGRQGPPSCFARRPLALMRNASLGNGSRCFRFPHSVPWPLLAPQAQGTGGEMGDTRHNQLIGCVSDCIPTRRELGEPLHVGVGMKDFEFKVNLVAVVRVLAADESVARQAVPEVLGAPSTAEIRLANQNGRATGRDATVTSVDFAIGPIKPSKPL